jgi:hypothetical protein
MKTLTIKLSDEHLAEIAKAAGMRSAYQNDRDRNRCYGFHDRK